MSPELRAAQKTRWARGSEHDHEQRQGRAPGTGHKRGPGGRQQPIGTPGPARWQTKPKPGPPARAPPPKWEKR
eukprot:3576514-Alexandrium_andersonii.AAC.1